MTVTDLPSSRPPRPGSPARRYPGVLVSIEGGDGVGKTTQINLLGSWLREQGREVLTTREPGGTELGREIRRLLLHEGAVSARAEALLYAADRAHHVDTVIRPALVRGEVVITDRYLDSSVAYQGVARSLGAGEVRDLSLWATGGLLPDLTILLDADPRLTARRAERRGSPDRLERDLADAGARLRQEFLALAAAEPGRFRVVDASGTVEEVAAAVRQVLAPVLDAALPGGALPDGTAPGGEAVGRE